MLPFAAYFIIVIYTSSILALARDIAIARDIALARDLASARSIIYNRNMFMVQATKEIITYDRKLRLLDF
jgi:hypothetical protein